MPTTNNPSEGRSSTAAHTPGPWRVIAHSRGIEDGLPMYVMSAPADDVQTTVAKVHSGRTEWDAHLIAAAPDMLAALQHALRYLRYLGKDDGECGDEIERAMHKAGSAS